MMNRYGLTTLALAAALFLAPAPQIAVPALADEAAETTAEVQIATPAFLTDAGQGNTARMVDMMLQRAGIEGLERDDTGTADALTADHGVLMIGVGASSKGLGAAGLDANAELDRIKVLIDKAKEHNIPIVGVHIGGEARRGELSDRFNRLVAENADIMVVWEASDEDGFFRDICEDKGTRYISVAQRPQSGAAIAELFDADGNGE